MVADPNQLAQSVDKALTSSTLTIATLLNDPVLLNGFIEDVAQGIHPPSDLAVRYSLDPRDMVALIRDNPEVRRRIQTRRAVWESGENIEGRIRKYAGVTVLEALPASSSVLFDKTAPAGTRLDTLKAFSRMAGVDGLPGGNKPDGNRAGTSFIVNFRFSGGRIETVSATTVVENDEQQPAAEQ